MYAFIHKFAGLHRRDITHVSPEEMSAQLGIPAEQAPTLSDMIRNTERDMIVGALEQAGFNKALAARMLGIPRSTLYYKMKALGLKVSKI